MRYSANKDFCKLVKIYVGNGWRYERGTKHGRLYSPCGTRFASVNGSPSDGHAFENFKADMKKLEKELQNA
jgi:hypothetical protein